MRILQCRKWCKHGTVFKALIAFVSGVKRERRDKLTTTHGNSESGHKKMKYMGYTPERRVNTYSSLHHMSCRGRIRRLTDAQ